MNRAIADSLSGISQLEVSMGGRTVGTLAETGEGRLAFQYDPGWIAGGYSISPFSLPLDGGVRVANRSPLDGAFGVFADSLPDGWGRLLVDRQLRARGVDPYEVGNLARLAIVGSSGMGALEYRPQLDIAEASAMQDLDAIAAACAEVLRSDRCDDLDQLVALGGSSGGARPKSLVEVDGEHWIVKFPSTYDPEGIGAIEYACSLAAKAAGIPMPETRLFASRTSSGYFGVRRFDRIGTGSTARRVHVVSVAGLLETSHRIPNLDYDDLMKLTLRITSDLNQVGQMFRLMCFNVLIGNRDDHSKNFSFVHDGESGYVLSPAYDLTPSPGMNGEHATTVNGKGKGVTDDDLVEAGVRNGLSDIAVRKVLAQVRDAVGDAGLLASES